RSFRRIWTNGLPNTTSKGHTPGNIALDERLGRHSRLPRTWRSIRCSIKTINRHERTLAFLPHRPPTAAREKYVKGSVGCGRDFARPLSQPLTFWSGGYLCLSRKECLKPDCQIKS